MSTSIQTTDPSTTNFNAIFEAASNEYKTLTGQDRETHPFAAALEDYTSPNSVLNVFRKQARTFDTFCKGEDKLMGSLTPIVHILFDISEILGKWISLPSSESPTKTLFTAIGVLLTVARTDNASYNTLVNQFERIHLFLQRLDHYTFTPEATELLAKIMTQILSIVALSTKAMKEKRIKMLMKKVVGGTEVEDALQKLDSLTKEDSIMMVRNLEDKHHFDDEATLFEETFQDIHNNVRATQKVSCDLGSDVQETNLGVIKRDLLPNVDDPDDFKVTKLRNQSREKFRKWLSPPNPSTNHNAACDSQHDGTASWFMSGNKFDEWKKNGSLLWIRGNPGSGKSVLCSAIIKDIKQMQISKSALVAYYYFDFKDAAKRNIRGLLTSLLLQLVDDSYRCWDLLSQLHKSCRDGSEQPGEASLVQCLKSMLDFPGQLPTYIIIDALDECPNSSGTRSAREKVLNFVEDLVKSSHPNLFICITSRPEQDITAILSPLASPSRRLSLHEEVGQREDINDYIRSFIQSNSAMRSWRTEDKELLINVLSGQTNGRFRWAYCQLEDLRRCMPSSIREILDDLYERILHDIPNQLRRHAHRLFQCMVVAHRPLRVEELAEIFTIEFGLAGALSVIVKCWRPANLEQVVLCACSTLITTIVDEKGSKTVQFSHVSIKEFLTSDRIQKKDAGKISQYHIALEPAHTHMARISLTTLLQLDGKVDKTRVARSPLAFYAAQHWIDHANFGNAAMQIQNPMERLFNPRKPHFRIWIWLRRLANAQSTEGIDERPPCPKMTPLYYAALYGFGELARRLIVTHKENVNATGINKWTPLHAASHGGHVDAVRVLLNHGARVNSRLYDSSVPLHLASRNGHPKVVQLLLERRAASKMDTRTTSLNFAMCSASRLGHLEVVQVFLDHGAEGIFEDERVWSPYEEAKRHGQHDVVQLLLDHSGKKDCGKRNGVGK